MQRLDRYRTAEYVDQWRQQWGKPVIVDECGYEGDIEPSWGNVPATELVRRFWEGAVRGGYVGHGETYYRADEQLWWAKGGELTGQSPSRIDFLRRITAEAPGGILEPVGAPADTDAPAAGVAGQYHLIYFGLSQPLFCTLTPPPGRYRVEIIDTWHMTIDELPGTFESGRVDLPGRAYIAVRLTAAA
ncbi:DUF5605 domain-containing protein [Nonomuraea jabiensis]|uniref:DUF5605 domain-containing protein n=1 Tax=Nonomuraea jabiensis TaxID=882448 RepID=A0A7W9GD20_9ACTN|nr:DUF5605 domain-containing protein [Nonomuraea jabiensis]MBB5781549.1 hypothetical protein [Nonomuraea jabiensis]